MAQNQGVTNQIFPKIDAVAKKNKQMAIMLVASATAFGGFFTMYALRQHKNKVQAESTQQNQNQSHDTSAASIPAVAPSSFDNFPDYIKQVDEKAKRQPQSQRNGSNQIGNQNVNSIINDQKMDEAARTSKLEPDGVKDELKRQREQEEAEDSEVYLGTRKKAARSPYEVLQGTYIPAVLETGLNSDLAGYASAVVRQNVYDSISGSYLLIPKGTRIFGKYENKVAYGQKRLLIDWNRLIFADGSSISIKGMPGTDRSGYSGFQDEVDNHFSSLMSGAILMTIIGAGAQLSQPQSSSGLTPSPSQAMGQTFAAQAGNNIANIAGQVVQKNLNISPTITVRPGYQFNIIVNKDMILEPYDNDN